MRPDRDLLERGPHEDPVSALAGVGSCSFVRRESLQRSARFAPFGPSGVGVAIRLRPLQPIRFSCTLFPRAEPLVLLEAVQSLERRRLATSWMLTLRAPSFHIGAGRAFTSCVPTSDAPCHLPAPARRLLFRLPAPCPSRHSRAVEVWFYRETRIVPPSPRYEEPSPLYEKMEERLEASSVVSVRLPASADPRRVSASPTRRFTAPDRTE